MTRHIEVNDDAILTHPFCLKRGDQPPRGQAVYISDCRPYKDDGRVIYPDRKTQQKHVKEHYAAMDRIGAKQDAVGMREYLKDRR